MTDRMVVGVDGSEANRPAVAWAIREARARDCEVLAIWAWHIPAFAYSAPGYAPIRDDWAAEDFTHMLDTTMADFTEDRRGRVEKRVLEGSAYDILREAASEPGVGLVVVGSRGHGPVANVFLGSVSHGLSHHCPKPLVIVPRRVEPQALAADMRRVVVGVDGSDGAERALRWAADEAKLYGARLQVVAAWTWTPPPVWRAGQAQTWREAQVGAHDVISQALDRLDPHGVDIELCEREGPAPEVLLDSARSADLLVVGSRGLGRVKEVALGSTSHQCTHHSSVPVVVVPDRQ